MRNSELDRRKEVQAGRGALIAERHEHNRAILRAIFDGTCPVRALFGNNLLSVAVFVCRVICSRRRCPRPVAACRELAVRAH